MSDISPLQQTLTDLGISAPVTTTDDSSRTELGQEDFLELMLAQLQNQDPMQPMENGDFMGDIAQFGTVDGIHNLEASFASFAESMVSNQALQASSLVGRTVSVPTDTNVLTDGGTISGTIELDNFTSNVNVSVYNQSGELMKTISLGDKQSGEVDFVWDGLDQDGQAAAAGTYRFEVQGKLDNQSYQLPFYMDANVDSVTIGKGSEGILLNLAGIGSIELDKVASIN